MYFLGKKKGILDSDEKCGTGDSREKEAGMRGQDPQLPDPGCLETESYLTSTVDCEKGCKLLSYFRWIF